jgi:hypothetical protein
MKASPLMLIYRSTTLTSTINRSLFLKLALDQRSPVANEGSSTELLQLWRMPPALRLCTQQTPSWQTVQLRTDEYEQHMRSMMVGQAWHHNKPDRCLNCLQ